MLQDAVNFWELNKVEEGGGGYLAWNWDSSIWGAEVLLAQMTNDPNYGSEVCPATPANTQHTTFTYPVLASR